MRTTETQTQLLDIIRGLLDVQSRHCEQITALHRLHCEFIDAIAGQSGTQEPTLSSWALRKAAAEIAELEALFRRDSDTETR